MGIHVQTGHTKSAAGLSLISHSFKSAQKEPVILLLQVHASSQEAKTLEKECETVIKNSLLETEGDAGERLDGTLKEFNGLLKGFLVAKTIDDVHAIIAILGRDETLHVSHAGRAEGYIIRGGQASQITEYTKGKPTPGFVHIASGSLEPRDTVVFSTQRLLRHVTPAQLAKHAQRGDQFIDELEIELEAEKERAAFGVLRVEAKRGKTAERSLPLPLPKRSNRRRGGGEKRKALKGVLAATSSAVSVFSRAGSSLASSRWTQQVRSVPGMLLADLKHPKRKKRAHLFIVAGAVAIFLVIWAAANLSTSTQRSQTWGELKELVAQIDGEIRTAENRYLTGDVDAANAILERAQGRAMQVMDNESGMFRMEALDLLDRIRLKGEEINNIVRLSPRVVVNIAAKNPNVAAQGVLGIGDGELIVYDRQDLYRILLNSIDEPDRLSDEELIVDASNFERMQTLLFQMTDNSIVEIISGQPTSMKTEDEAGWIMGNALQTYLRFLYVLSPENNQIYKYERLSNRYAAPAEYNVNGDLEGAIDIAIDGNIYVLKEEGKIVRLFRGEVRSFVIRHLPENALTNVSKIFKVEEDGNFYILDPVGSRVIVATDGGPTGESAYVRQYMLEGDQVGELKDLHVDSEELLLTVIDEKRVYAIDLAAR